MACDLTSCPCGDSTPMEVYSIERVEGRGSINLFNEDGTVSAQWGGDTDMLWDTTVTLCYHCAECGEELPEEYQKELDRLLDNTRVQEGAAA